MDGGSPSTGAKLCNSGELGKTRVQNIIDGFVYTIRFKRSDRFFLRSGVSAELPSIAPGTLLRVEGDRGEDVGVLISRGKLRDIFDEPRANTIDMPTIVHRQRRILRTATEIEGRQLEFKSNEEDKATAYIQK